MKIILSGLKISINRDKRLSLRIHIDLSNYKKISENQGMAFKSFSASKIIKRLSTKTIHKIFQK